MLIKIAKAKYFILLFLTYFALYSTSVYAADATLLPNGLQQFFDENGDPLTSGTVDFYFPSTLNRKTTWKNSTKTLVNTNPIILDAAGRAQIYGDGIYRQILKKSNGNTVWDVPTASFGSGSGTATVGDGDSVGTIKPWAGLVPPSQYAFTFGQELSRTSFPELFAAITLSQSVSCSSGSPILTALSDTTQIPIGGKIEVSCAPSGSTISSKTSTTVTLNNNATLSTTVSARFFLYGNGNGSTTFNLPDFRGYVLAGRNNMGGIASSTLTSQYFLTNPDATGAKGGLQTHTLNTGELPIHTPAGTIGGTSQNYTPAGTIGGTSQNYTPAGTIGGTSQNYTPAGTVGGTTNSYTPTGTVNITDPGHFHTYGSAAVQVVQGGAGISPSAPGTGNTSTVATGLNSGNVLFSGNAASPSLAGTATFTGTLSTVPLGANASFTGTIGTVPLGANATFTGTSATVPLGANATFTGTQIGAGFAFSIIQPTVTVNYIIKTSVDTSSPIILSGLAQNHIYVGNVSNEATDVAVSGDINIISSGLVTINDHAITNAKLSQSNATTIKGNPTNLLADPVDFTIQSLTSIPVLDPNLDLLVIQNHTTGTLQKVTPGQIATVATSGVTSIGALTGVIALGSGLTTSGGNTILTTGLLSTTLSNGKIHVGSAGNLAVEQAMSGDCTIIASAAITCLKTNNVNFGTSATINTGTAGATIPLLNGNNTYSGTATFTAASTFSNTVSLGSLATATTSSAGDNDTSVATTAFVQNESRRKNWLFNSSFLFAQHLDTTSTVTTQHFVSTAKYTLDRWWATRFGTPGLVISRIAATSGVTPVSGVPFKIVYQKDTGNTSTQVTALCQALPYDVSVALSGKNVTFSYYGTAGATWSSATGGATGGQLTSRIITGTGASGIGGEQSMAGMIGATWTGWAQTTQTNVITGTRTRFSTTATIGSTVNEMSICLQVDLWNAGASGGSTYVELDSLKLEVGSSATEYLADEQTIEWPRVAAFYEDLGRVATSGIRVLKVPAIVTANGLGAGCGGTCQNWFGNVEFMAKRYTGWTCSLGVGPVVALIGPSHVTYAGGTSIYDLILDQCGHNNLDRMLIEFHWIIDGTHPAMTTNGMGGAFAIDGSSNAAFFIIDAEIN